MKRVLCLYIPQLSIERIGSGGARSGREPVIVTDNRHGVSSVVRANGAAEALGVRAGMTAAEARALAPGVAVEARDASADRRALEALAHWAGCFSPIVHIEDPDTLLLDVTGCERLFGGEWDLLRQAVDGLRERGFSARAALADTVGAAWTLAHVRYEAAVVVERGETVAALSPLPVGALRIDDAAVCGLRAVGIETIGALLHVPRSSVAVRFGDAVLRRLDQALGRAQELLSPFRPPPVLKSQLYLGGPTRRRDVLNEAIDRALDMFCEQLSTRMAGVRRVNVTFYGDGGGPYTFAVGVSRATRSANRLRGLARVRLEGFHLPAPVHTVMLWAREVEQTGAWQGDLFAPGDGDGERLADLVDRLSARLGPASVGRPVLVSDHQPEREYIVEGTEARRHEGTEARRDEGRGRDEGTEGRRGSRRPVWVFGRPILVTVMAVVPDGPPARFRWNGRQHEVVDVVGPERIETGWWRGPHIQRDYYRVTSSSGGRFWLFRDRATSGWYLHGVFD